MAPRRARGSGGCGRIVAVGLRVNRRSLPQSPILELGTSLGEQLLESPVKGGALRLISQNLTDVAARELPGQARQGGENVGLYLCGAPAAGPLDLRLRLLP